jgi:hypothetical protein
MARGNSSMRLKKRESAHVNRGSYYREKNQERSACKARKADYDLTEIQSGLRLEKDVQSKTQQGWNRHSASLSTF